MSSEEMSITRVSSGGIFLACEQALSSGGGAGEDERRRELATMSQEFEYLRRKIRRKMLIGGDFIWLLRHRS